MRYLLMPWLVVLAGCDITAPVAPHPFDPPAEYVAWAADMLACVGKPSTSAPNFVRAISWMIADDFVNEPGYRLYGLWDDGAIYLRAEGVLWRRLVVHEMIHQHLDGDRNHTNSVWRCDHAWLPE